MTWLRIIVSIFLVVPATAAPLKIRVVDPSGAPFSKVLVIVKSLQGGGEVARDLTDSNGRVPVMEVGNGLYRIIATCPYGLCGTAVKEFSGERLPTELLVNVPIPSSDTNGELIGTPILRVDLRFANGAPASGMHLLVRDQEAKWEKWYVADERGTATIELPDDPIVLVALYHGTVFTLQVQTGCVRGPNGLQCTKIDLSRDLIWQL
jgi:hypothetical protein